MDPIASISSIMHMIRTTCEHVYTKTCLACSRTLFACSNAASTLFTLSSCDFSSSLYNTQQTENGVRGVCVCVCAERENAETSCLWRVIISFCRCKSLSDCLSNRRADAHSEERRRTTLKSSLICVCVLCAVCVLSLFFAVKEWKAVYFYGILSMMRLSYIPL